MSKILDMSEIRVLIYRLDTYNLKTKIVSFQDQEKFLQEVVFSLMVSMNANTKSSQIKYCPWPKYVVIKRLNLHNLQTRKKSEQWPRAKIYLLKYVTLKSYTQYYIKSTKTMLLFLTMSQMQCTIYRPDLHNSQASRKQLRK